MANVLFPDAVDGPASAQEAHSILDQMISNGNKVAQVRKEELVHVEGLFMAVAARAEMNGLQPLTLSTSVNVEERPAEHRSDNNTEGQNLNRNREYVEDFVPIDLPNPGYTHTEYHPSMMMPSTELLDDIGISSAEFLAIVGQIGNPDTSYSILDLGP
jgi:proline utilization trans-activator